MKAENKKSRVYRYKTLEEIFEALQDNCSFEDYVGNGFPSTRYYIHINEDDLSIAPRVGGDVESFSAPYYGECDDDSFDWETLDNEDFRIVCEDLLEQVNSYIKERELEDD